MPVLDGLAKGGWVPVSIVIQILGCKKSLPIFRLSFPYAVWATQLRPWRKVIKAWERLYGLLLNFLP